MKKNKMGLNLAFFVLLLAGCNATEIEENAFVASIGIDSSDNHDKPYKITLKIFIPTASFKDRAKPDYLYITQDAQSPTEAIHLLETKVDKKLEFGHTKLIVFGEDFIKEQDAKDTLDFLVRRADIQFISYIIIGRPTAEEIIKMVPKSETIAYPAIYNYFDKNANESPYIVTTFLFDYRRELLEEGIEPVLPIVEFEEEEYKIDKSMVLIKGKRIELSPLETKLFNIIKGNIKKADLIVKGDDQSAEFTAELNQFDVKYKTIVNQYGNVTLRLDIKVVGLIKESKDQLKLKDLSTYNKMAEEETTERIQEFLQMLLEEGVDPIGFGVNYKTTMLHNKLMSNEEWLRKYKNAKIDINIDVQMKSTGLIE